MNRIIKYWSIAMVIALTVSCGSNTKQKNEEVTEEIVSETESEESVTEENNSSSIINPNLATAEELESSGLTTELVTQITENRPFLSMTDLNDLIGESMDSTQKAALYEKVFIKFNLNTTPEDDFKLIPGVGDRMAHEFEEYRPYVKIAQFREEMGKYVDDEEIVRFEHYVFVPVELNSATKEEILAIPGVGDRMLHEFEEYRPYKSMEQFRKEIGKYVDENELKRLERFVYLSDEK
ncbi:MAG: hypothetical protein AAF363_07535 [Bacteroidota bacterium]